MPRWMNAEQSKRFYVHNRDVFDNLGTRLTANVCAFQDSVNRVMTHLRFALQFANYCLENLFFDLVVRDHLLRVFVLDVLELDEAQIFALFPFTGDFLSFLA